MEERQEKTKSNRKKIKCIGKRYLYRYMAYFRYSQDKENYNKVSKTGKEYTYYKEERD